MKTNCINKLSIVASVMLVTVTAYAQIDPTVEVSRLYKVNVMEINKPETKDNFVADSLQKFANTFDYSIFNKPYSDLYEFTPYQIDSIKKVEKQRTPYIMARAGAQFPLSPEFVVKSQLAASPRLNIGLNAAMNTFFGNLDYQGVPDALNASRLNSAVNANMKHAWENGEMDLMLGYMGDNYKDTYLGQSLDHKVNTLTVGFNVESAMPQDNSLYYNFDFNFNKTAKCLSGLPELDTTYNNSLLTLQGRIGSSFDKHRIYIDLIYKSAFYDKGEDKPNTGVLEFTPIYEYSQGRVKIKAGARFGNIFLDRDAQTTLHPELDCKVELVKNGLWLRGILVGGNDINSIANYVHDAPWLCMGLKDGSYSAGHVLGSRGIDSKVALESIVAGRFALSPYFAYCSYSDKMQFFTLFSPTDLPILVPVYTDYNEMSLGVETSWKSKDLTITGTAQRNSYSSKAEEPLFMLPKYELSASMEYNFKERFFLSANFHYESEKDSWRGGTVPEYIDLSVMATYAVNRHFSAYVKGGNLLNNLNFRYFAIPEMPRNIGAGVAVNF